MANELEPSTLEPLMPASAPALKTGMGANAACPTICDLEASLESLYWNSQLTAKALLPARKSASTAFSSDATELGFDSPSSIVCFIQVRTCTPFSSLNTGLPLASRKAPPLPNSSTVKSHTTPSFWFHDQMIGNSAMPLSLIVFAWSTSSSQVAGGALMPALDSMSLLYMKYFTSISHGMPYTLPVRVTPFQEAGNIPDFMSAVT